MNLEEIVRSLNHHNFAVLENVHMECSDDEAVRLICELLKSAELRDDAAIAVELLRILIRLESQEHVERWVVERWPMASDGERRRIAFVLQDPEILPTRVAVRLFDDSSSHVADRHRVLAGLAVSASARGCRDLVVELLAKIGEYDDPQQQAILERFAASVIASYGC